jgi:hypothetical protein
MENRIEERVAKLEGAVEEARLQLGRLSERVARIDGVVEQISLRIATLENRFTWMLGIQISMWVTIILAVLVRK